MKLKWETGTGLILQVADGEQYSYQIGLDTTGLPTRRYLVYKLRQPAGQVVNRTIAMTLEGAYARAQTWEDHG